MHRWFRLRSATLNSALVARLGRLDLLALWARKVLLARRVRRECLDSMAAMHNLGNEDRVEKQGRLEKREVREWVERRAPTPRAAKDRQDQRDPQDYLVLKEKLARTEKEAKKAVKVQLDPRVNLDCPEFPASLVRKGPEDQAGSLERTPSIVRARRAHYPELLPLTMEFRRPLSPLHRNPPSRRKHLPRRQLHHLQRVRPHVEHPHLLDPHLLLQLLVVQVHHRLPVNIPQHRWELRPLHHLEPHMASVAEGINTVILLLFLCHFVYFISDRLNEFCDV